jgi:hypothetical protein
MLGSADAGIALTHLIAAFFQKELSFGQRRKECIVISTFSK